MNPRLSTKILRPDFQGEFTASILAAAASPDLISFAGGLPNPVSFPVEAMDKATHKVLEKNGVMALQYSGTQGYLPLRLRLHTALQRRAGLRLKKREIMRQS